jgi:hypothetical protein
MQYVCEAWAVHLLKGLLYQSYFALDLAFNVERSPSFTYSLAVQLAASALAL